MTVAVAASSDDVRRALERTSAGTPSWQAAAAPATRPRRPCKLAGPWKLDTAKLTAWLAAQGAVPTAADPFNGAARSEAPENLNWESFGEYAAPVCYELLELARSAGALTEPIDLELTMIETRWQEMMIGVRRVGEPVGVFRFDGVSLFDLASRVDKRQGPKLICDLISGLLAHANTLANKLPAA